MLIKLPRTLSGHVLRRHDENGSLVVVLTILFVIGLLSAATINRVVGDFNNNTYETNLEQARALAQSGVADALFRIDQSDASPGNFCLSPTVSGCLSGIPSAGGVQYTAHWSSASSTYTVFSRGTAHGVTYNVKAVIGPNPIIKSALTGATITFNGTTKLGNIQVTGSNGYAIPGATADISVATGGTMTCNGGGGSPPNILYLEYKGSSTNCTPVTPLTSSYTPEPPSPICPPPSTTTPPTPCMPGDVQSCNKILSQGSVTGDPNNGYTISSTTSGGTTVPALLEPGSYACYGGLTITGTVNVDYSKPGPVKIFVFGPQNNPQSPTNLTLDNGGGTTINACEVGNPTPGNPATNCVSGGQQIVGDPTDLQIYQYAGTVSVGSGLNSINTILWAPTTSLTTNGAANSLTLTGAMVIGSLSTNGQPVTFTLNYDERVETEFQVTQWAFQSYLQTSPFTIP